MKRFFSLFLIAIFLVSCEPARQEQRSAFAVLQDILSAYPLGEGYLYGTDEQGENKLTDELLGRIFTGMRLDDMQYVKDAAVYLSKRFHDGELLIFRLYDPSHAKAVLSLLQRRAEKKENAVLFQNGVYLYLICSEQNDAILRYVRG